MYYPRIDNEIDGLVAYLEVQLDALRESAHGLTEEQARLRPCRSALSIGGLIKHATFVMDGVLGERRSPTQDTDSPAWEQLAAQFYGSFALTDDESLQGALEAFDATRAAYLAEVRGADPDEVVLVGPAPWDGVLEPVEVARRYSLVHHVEELARHAGHADIIREQIDGATGPALHLAARGLPGNDFVQPWTPAAI